jgi:hypothetical protein
MFDQLDKIDAIDKFDFDGHVDLAALEKELSAYNEFL